MDDITKIVGVDITPILDAFDAIQMPRTDFTLRHFAVESEDTQPAAYAHCTLELQTTWDNLRIAKHKIELAELEINELIEKGDKKSLLEAEVKKIELEQVMRARLGALREFETLYKMWCAYPKYTREELDADQEEYWRKRLSRQANNDMLATGRVGQGNLNALQQIGLGTVPQLDVVRDVERRYLVEGKQRILIAVPTVDKAVTGLPCLENLIMPGNAETKIFNVYGRPVADAYNCAAQQAIEDNADWMITVEDDTFPQEDAIIRLFQLAKNNPGCAIGAWYPMRDKTLRGTHIYLKNNTREYLESDEKIHEVYTLAMGCSIYPVEMFIKIPRPWFATTTMMTQDSFFSQQAREHGYKLLVDTSIKCTHRDRDTSDIYSINGVIPSALQVPEELDELLKKYVSGKKLILEIGTMRGGTLYQFLQVADDNAEVISIDKPNGKYGGEYGQTDSDVMQSWKRNGQQLHIIRDDSQSQYAKEQVETILHGRKLDFVFVDGDHSYQGVKADYDRYKRFTKGIMAFHDIVEHAQPDVGVKRFWDELTGYSWLDELRDTSLDVLTGYGYNPKIIKTEIIKDPAQEWGGIGILEVA